MRIAILSTYDIQGGAAISAYRLMRGFNNNGHECRMFVQSKYSHDKSVITETGKYHRFLNQVRPSLDRLPLYPTRVSESYSTGLLRNPRMVAAVKKFNPDVVHLQWVNGGFFSLTDVQQLNIPIVWRLPDWWLLTAGCHLPYDCKLYQKDCSHCPILKPSTLFDRSASLLKHKINGLKRIKNIKFVSPSRALAADAARSNTLAHADVRVIPNGLDLATHKPLDKKLARQAFNLPLNQKIVLFGAVNGRNDPNKGYKWLMQALSLVTEHSSIEFSCVAFGSEAGLELHDNILVRSVGILRDQQSLNLLYSAADVFVVPSYQESFGQTAIEAMACGTPVVAFKTTGLLDIVDSGQNGYLAEKFNVEDLAKGIAFILTHTEKSSLAIAARTKIEREFNINSVVERYLSLYEEVISQAQY